VPSEPPGAAPRVSVVIPHFNDARYVPQTVASLREAEPVEVIVVDDGSTDADVAPCLDALEARGVRVERRPHAGVAAAINHGAAVARAPYVFIMGADDLFEPGGAGVLADALDADPGAGFAFGDYRLFGAREGHVRTYEWEPWRAWYANCWSGVFMIRRDLFLSLGGLPARSHYEDWDLFMTLAQERVRGVRVPHVVFHYRQAAAGRRYRSNMHRMREETRMLRAAHPRLRAMRRDLERESGSPRLVVLAWPLVFGLRERLPVRAGDALFGALAALRRLQHRLPGAGRA
jgi:glycosyltransferase involved in cell wall biosynthesis